MKKLEAVFPPVPYEVRNENQAIYTDTFRVEPSKRAKEIIDGLKKLLPGGTWTVVLNPDTDNEEIIR
jgi:hypothetical protein